MQETNPVKIKKAKIKEELFLEVEYSEDLPGHSKKDTKLSCTVPVHDDLKNAFQNLHKHLALLCDQIKAKVKNIETFTHEDLGLFSVRGFSIGGNEDNEGVTISGMFEGKYGIVNLNTPFTKYESVEYPFVSELADNVESCLYEVTQYLFHDGAPVGNWH